MNSNAIAFVKPSEFSVLTSGTPAMGYFMSWWSEAASVSKFAHMMFARIEDFN